MHIKGPPSSDSNDFNVPWRTSNPKRPPTTTRCSPSGHCRAGCWPPLQDPVLRPQQENIGFSSAGQADSHDFDKWKGTNHPGYISWSASVHVQNKAFRAVTLWAAVTLTDLLCSGLAHQQCNLWSTPAPWLKTPAPSTSAGWMHDARNATLANPNNNMYIYIIYNMLLTPWPTTSHSKRKITNFKQNQGPDHGNHHVLGIAFWWMMQLQFSIKVKTVQYSAHVWRKLQITGYLDWARILRRLLYGRCVGLVYRPQDIKFYTSVHRTMPLQS